MYVGKERKKIFLHHYFAVFLGCLGDTQFCFRFRQGSNRKSSLGCFLETTDRDAPPCLKVCRPIHDFGPMACYAACTSAVWLTLLFVRLFQREQGHYYGYVYFRQVRDKSLKRGYFQKVGDWSHFSFCKTSQEPSKSHISIIHVVMAWGLHCPFYVHL